MCDMLLLKAELYSVLEKKGAKLIGIADLKGIVKGNMQTGISVPVWDGLEKAVCW